MKYDSALFAEHLAGMVRIPTISNADPSQVEWEAFEALHQYIEKTWPLVHRHLEKTVVGKAGLLYRWKSPRGEGKPALVLIAHQDVVPPGDPRKWTEPPFAGRIAQGCVWGRGSLDCKSHLNSYFEAIEGLLADGFEPEADVYIASGYNEEVMGGDVPAADLLAQELERRGVTIGLLLDEGGALEEKDGQLIANVATCEKGYADFELVSLSSGGHSARPPKHSSLGLVAQAICAVENNPLPLRLSEPVAIQMRALSALKSQQGTEKGTLFADPEKNFARLEELCAQDKPLNAMLRSTCAVTMAGGSEQANVLPDRAWAVVNCRLLPGDTVETMQQHLESLMPEGVQVRLIRGTNPPSVSSLDTEGYAVLKDVLNAMYPGIAMVPGMVLGGTDARYYCRLSPAVFRFTGFKKDSRWGAPHQIDEKLPCDAIEGDVRFYVNLITRWGR